MLDGNGRVRGGIHHDSPEGPGSVLFAQRSGEADKAIDVSTGGSNKPDSLRYLGMKLLESGLRLKLTSASVLGDHLEGLGNGLNSSRVVLSEDWMVKSRVPSASAKWELWTTRPFEISSQMLKSIQSLLTFGEHTVGDNDIGKRLLQESLSSPKASKARR